MRIISKSGLVRSTTLGVLMLLASIAAQGQGTGSGAGSAAPAGNAQNGKKLYNAIGCWQCHGYSGQGGAATKIAPNPISYPSFTKYIRAPKGQMPPYTTKVLSESGLGDIYAFLLTIPKPPDPKTIPLLNPN